MVRNLNFSACLFLGIILLFARDAFGQATNFCPGARGPYVNIFAGPYVDVGVPQNPQALQMGVLGGVGVDDKLYVGAYFGTMLSQGVRRTFTHLDTTYTATMQFNQGGISVQWSPLVFRFMRFMIGSRLGFARVTWRDPEADHTFRAGGLIASPTFSVEFPLLYYTRLELGAGYRWMAELALPKAVKDIDGVFFYGALRFGSF
jgi:hypothetical protein